MVASVSSSSFAPTRNQGIKIPKIFLPIDHPENGGISGTIKTAEKDKPSPFKMEERPTTIDPRTGERVYVDRLVADILKYPIICS